MMTASTAASVVISQMSTSQPQLAKARSGQARPERAHSGPGARPGGRAGAGWRCEGRAVTGDGGARAGGLAAPLLVEGCDQALGRLAAPGLLDDFGQARRGGGRQ